MYTITVFLRGNATPFEMVFATQDMRDGVFENLIRNKYSKTVRDFATSKYFLDLDEVAAIRKG